MYLLNFTHQLEIETLPIDNMFYEQRIRLTIINPVRDFTNTELYRFYTDDTYFYVYCVGYTVLKDRYYFEGEKRVYSLTVKAPGS